MTIRVAGRIHHAGRTIGDMRLIAMAIASLLLASSARAQDATDAALAAIRRRCPAIHMAACDSDAPDADAADFEASASLLDGDHARLATQCGGGGNGGGSSHLFTYDVDLARCRATVVYTGYEQTYDVPFDTVFQVFGLTSPPRTPLPSPPGVLFRPNDPTFAGTQLALAGVVPARTTVTSGDFVVSSPMLAAQPPTAGLPAAEPPSYLSILELHAIGATPSPRPVGPGPFLRAYRLTAGITAPTEQLRVGDYTVLGDSECIAVAHRPSSTFRRVLCTPTGLDWVGGDAGIAIATAEPQGWGGDEMDIIAVDLASGTAHDVSLAPTADDDVDVTNDDQVVVRDGALVVTIEDETPRRIALVDLLRAMRGAER